MINFVLFYGLFFKYRIIYVLFFMGKLSGNFFEGGKVILIIIFFGGFGYVYSFVLIENFIIIVEGFFKIDVW